MQTSTIPQWNWISSQKVRAKQPAIQFAQTHTNVMLYKFQYVPKNNICKPNKRRKLLLLSFCVVDVRVIIYLYIVHRRSLHVRPIKIKRVMTMTAWAVSPRKILIFNIMARRRKVETANRTHNRDPIAEFYLYASRIGPLFDGIEIGSIGAAFGSRLITINRFVRFRWMLARRCDYSWLLAHLIIYYYYYLFSFVFENSHLISFHRNRNASPRNYFTTWLSGSVRDNNSSRTYHQYCDEFKVTHHAETVKALALPDSHTSIALARLNEMNRFVRGERACVRKSASTARVHLLISFSSLIN